MRCIGLMSGTSLDGVDAALIETDGVTVARFGPGLELSYTTSDRAALQAAVDAALTWRFQGEEPPEFAGAEAVLHRTHAQAVQAVCDASGLSIGDIDLIGLHGQTVLHEAPAAQRPGRTCQIGDAQALATTLGRPVAHDFRSVDISRGGQGAPLAPAYHQALAAGSGMALPLGVLNIGGVANLTIIGPGGALQAFDTGPGNGLIDAWMMHNAGLALDESGRASSVGRVLDAALEELLAHPHFLKGGPKSLDRWDFSLDAARNLTVEDGAATLSEFTAQTVALGIRSASPGLKRLVVCGGGRKNSDLMARIERLTGLPVHTAEDVGWRGDLIEAEAFAFLAARTRLGRPISWPGTTGAPEPLTGGRIVEP